MKKLLSVLVAGAFAATSFTVVAQSKDVKDKKGATVTTKKGEAVTTKEMKDKPKSETKISLPKPGPGKPKEKGAAVKTKSGGPVTTKEGKDATSGKK